MTSTTSNYGISYPNVTDFVKDGANAIETVAEQVDAALFAQVANRNLLYNGAMQIAQRSTSAVTGITTTGYYTLDRWQVNIGSLGTFTMTPDTDVPTGQGFRRSLKLSCTTADASPAAGDLLLLQQNLEGQDLQAIRKGTASAQQLTLSFWVKSYQTGTFIVELRDDDNNRSISKAYTVNVSATWEYKTVTFGADTTGAFDNDNASSMSVNWWLGAGSTYTSGTLATSWASTTSANRAVGVTNLASSTSNYWSITGVQLTIGATAMPFQFKSYQQELRECQRYYIKESDHAIVMCTDQNGTPSTGRYATVQFPTYVRTATYTVSGTTAAGPATAYKKAISGCSFSRVASGTSLGVDLWSWTIDAEL